MSLIFFLFNQIKDKEGLKQHNTAEQTELGVNVLVFSLSSLSSCVTHL